MVNHPNRSKKSPMRKYKGVYEYLPGRFKARIGIDGKTVYLGVYTDVEEAAAAYKQAAIAARGESELAKIRNETGLSQAEAAKLVHKSEIAWRKWESGERKMPGDAWELFQLKIKWKDGLIKKVGLEEFEKQWRAAHET